MARRLSEHPAAWIVLVALVGAEALVLARHEGQIEVLRTLAPPARPEELARAAAGLPFGPAAEAWVREFIEREQIDEDTAGELMGLLAAHAARLSAIRSMQEAGAVTPADAQRLTAAEHERRRKALAALLGEELARRFDEELSRRLDGGGEAGGAGAAPPRGAPPAGEEAPAPAGEDGGP